MLEKHKVRRTQPQAIINEVSETLGGEQPTAKEVLTYMVGDGYGRSGEYAVYSYQHKTPRTFLQRVNALWVYPLFIITIPLQYLVKGEIGVNRNSRIGGIIDKLVKFG